MEKEKILNKLLIKFGTSLVELQEKMRRDYPQCIGCVAYTSIFNLLGNNESDIDIYIITNEKNLSEGIISNVIIGEQLKLDIEVWSIASLKNRINHFTDSADIKLFQRLKDGAIVYYNQECQDFITSINRNEINRHVLDFFKLLARSDYEDAYSFYKVGDMISAVNCSRNAVRYQAASYNALKNNPIMKQKWIDRIYIDNMDQNSDSVSKYKELIIYTNVTDINEYIFDLLNLYQRIKFEVSVLEKESFNH